MSVIQVVRVGNRSAATVVRAEGMSGSAATVVDVSTGSRLRTGERWWQGEGPPPELIVGSRVGDMYWDTVTGNVYELDEGS